MNWRVHDNARSHFISSSDEAELKLHLRVRGEEAAGPPVLFVHGATFASRLYDIPHPGASWLQAAANAGFTAYALDVRGYGKSQSALMMSQSEPYARASQAIIDIDDAVAWICARHNVNRLRLVGGSWGSNTSALYAGTIGRERVARLVLYAPIYAERNAAWLELLRDREEPARFGSQWRSFRYVDEAAIRRRWDAEIPTGQVAAWRDEDVFQALVQASFCDDPLSGETSPMAFRVPNGTFVDLWDAFRAHPVYDPKDVKCPTLLVRGSADPTSTRSDALSLFEGLGSVEKSYLEIANGAHFVSAERRAPLVFSAVNGFLGIGAGMPAMMTS